MSTMEPLCQLIGINPNLLPKSEYFILEAFLFLRLCEELTEIFRKERKQYFGCLRFTKEMENNMLESDFARLIIKDILSTTDYTLQGIAIYTNTHEDVVCDVVTGQHCPTATFFRRIIDLHRSVRKNLYDSILKKIILEHSNTGK